jgi:hypothetical protein
MGYSEFIKFMLIMENFQLHSNVSEISNELDLMLHVHQIWDVVVKKQWYCIIYIYIPTLTYFLLMIDVAIFTWTHLLIL